MRFWIVQRAESTVHDEGGTRRVQRVSLLAGILANRGHEVIWWTSSFDHVGKKHRVKASTRISTKEGYDIHYLKTLGYKKNMSFDRIRDNISLSKSLRKEMKLDPNLPDVILASVPSVELALDAANFAVKRSIPIIVDIRDLYPDVFRDLVSAQLKPVVDLVSIPMRNRLRKLCHKASAIIGLTEAFVDWGISHANRTRCQQDKVFRMAYSPPSKDSKKDCDFWLERPLGQDNDCLQVIFLGTFTNSFRFGPVIKAAQALQKAGKKIQFTFCGNGANSAELELQCRSLKNCDFVGWINAPQIQVALELADVGLAPYIASSNFINNIPNKPAEYMSGGLVVMTSLNEGPLAELLRTSGSGKTYCNAEQLSESLIEIFEKKILLKNMKIASKKAFSEYFDALTVYGGLADYLEEF